MTIRSKQWYTKSNSTPKSFSNSSIGTTVRRSSAQGRNKGWRVSIFVSPIQRRAAEHDGRFVTIGQLVFFSTETGDAWMLDPTDRLAARLARDGDPEAN